MYTSHPLRYLWPLFKQPSYDLSVYFSMNRSTRPDLSPFNHKLDQSATTYGIHVLSNLHMTLVFISVRIERCTKSDLSHFDHKLDQSAMMTSINFDVEKICKKPLIFLIQTHFFRKERCTKSDLITLTTNWIN